MHIKFAVTSDVMFELDVNKDQIASFFLFLLFHSLISRYRRIEQSYQQNDSILDLILPSSFSKYKKAA